MNEHEMFGQTWKNKTEIFEMLKEVCGEEVLSTTLVFGWCKCLSKGRDGAELDS
jgi:hypothetical protein